MRRDLVSPLFVGREAELATLTAALKAAVDGRPRWCSSGARRAWARRGSSGRRPTPARVLGLSTGALEPGLSADLVVLDDEPAVRSVMVRGAWSRPAYALAS